MILLDTNVLIYAFNLDSPFSLWANETIEDAVSEEGAAINPVTLAELSVGDTAPATLVTRLQHWGIETIDLPVAAAEPCAEAYRTFLKRRLANSGKPAPGVPLPDFFIGAHAQIMNWEIATADKTRFTTYFPKVRLITPQ